MNILPLNIIPGIGRNPIFTSRQYSTWAVAVFCQNSRRRSMSPLTRGYEPIPQRVSHFATVGRDQREELLSLVRHGVASPLVTEEKRWETTVLEKEKFNVWDTKGKMSNNMKRRKCAEWYYFLQPWLAASSVFFGAWRDGYKSLCVQTCKHGVTGLICIFIFVWCLLTFIVLYQYVTRGTYVTLRLHKQNVTRTHRTQFYIVPFLNQWRCRISGGSSSNLFKKLLFFLIVLSTYTLIRWKKLLPLPVQSNVSVRITEFVLVQVNNLN